MTQVQEQARPRKFGLGILAFFSIFLAYTAYNGRLPQLTAASAQEVVQPDASATAPEAITPTPDPITNRQVELLQEDGLIGRQLVINEGLLLMDRQLRQAQVADQLLAALGPDALIEVEPGEFRNYADTPTGLRRQIDYLKLQQELEEARRWYGEGPNSLAGITQELAALKLQQELRHARVDLSADPDTPDNIRREIESLRLRQELRQARLDLGEDLESGRGNMVSEVYGRTGRYTAVVSVEGRRTSVKVGDLLADGTEVLEISEYEVRLKRPDLTIERLRSPD